MRATNHGIPEGLARVLDMMAANVAPELLSSDLKDGNGQNLAGQAKAKAERLKTLRAEISQIENRLSAAKDGADASIIRLKKVADIQLNSYRELLGRKLRESDPSQYDEEIKKLQAAVASDPSKQAELNSKIKEQETAKEQSANYTQCLEEINQSWSGFQTQASDYVKLLADSGSEPEDVSSLFALKAIEKETAQDGKETIKGIKDYATGESQYEAMFAAQNNAVNKKTEYSDAMSGKALPDKSA